MIQYKKETVEEEFPVGMTCDVCKREFDCKKDHLEVQEFHHINIEGGYGSIFGDGAKIECDICQHCLKKILGEYIRINID